MFLPDAKRTYQIGNDHLAVEVDPQTEKSDTNTESLVFATECLFVHKGGKGVAGQNSSSRVEARNNMVFEYLLDELLGGLLVVLRDLLKRLVGWHKGCDVMIGSIQDLDKVRVLIDQLGELGRILRFMNRLVDCEVRSTVVVVAMMSLATLAGVFMVLQRRQEVRDFEVELWDKVKQ